MMRTAIIAALVLACGKPDAPPKRDESATPPVAEVQRPQKLKRLQMTVPERWTSRYDGDGDRWAFDSAPLADGHTAHARIERAPDSAVASPDAYLAHRLKYGDPGTTATIESRSGVKDGFAMTIVVKGPPDPKQPRRETYVVRQLGSGWYQCVSEWIPDDTIRDQLIALCKSLEL